MSDAVTVSRKGQVVIPRKVLEQAGLRPGQELMPFVKRGVISLVPVPTLDELQGMFKGMDYSGYREPESEHPMCAQENR